MTKKKSSGSSGIGKVAIAGAALLAASLALGKKDDTPSQLTIGVGTDVTVPPADTGAGMVFPPPDYLNDPPSDTPPLPDSGSGTNDTPNQGDLEDTLTTDTVGTAAADCEAAVKKVLGIKTRSIDATIAQLRSVTLSTSNYKTEGPNLISAITQQVRNSETEMTEATAAIRDLMSSTQYQTVADAKVAIKTQRDAAIKTIKTVTYDLRIHDNDVIAKDFYDKIKGLINGKLILSKPYEWLDSEKKKYMDDYEQTKLSIDPNNTSSGSLSTLENNKKGVEMAYKSGKKFVDDRRNYGETTDKNANALKKRADELKASSEVAGSKAANFALMRDKQLKDTIAVMKKDLSRMETANIELKDGLRILEDRSGAKNRESVKEAHTAVVNARAALNTAHKVFSSVIVDADKRQQLIGYINGMTKTMGWPDAQRASLSSALQTLTYGELLYRYDEMQKGRYAEYLARKSELPSLRTKWYAVYDEYYRLPGRIKPSNWKKEREAMLGYPVDTIRNNIASYEAKIKLINKQLEASTGLKTAMENLASAKKSAAKFEAKLPYLAEIGDATKAIAKGKGLNWWDAGSKYEDVTTADKYSFRLYLNFTKMMDNAEKETLAKIQSISSFVRHDAARLHGWKPSHSPFLASHALDMNPKFKSKRNTLQNNVVTYEKQVATLQAQADLAGATQPAVPAPPAIVSPPPKPLSAYELKPEPLPSYTAYPNTVHLDFTVYNLHGNPQMTIEADTERNGGTEASAIKTPNHPQKRPLMPALIAGWGQSSKKVDNYLLTYGPKKGSEVTENVWVTAVMQVFAGSPLKLYDTVKIATTAFGVNKIDKGSTRYRFVKWPFFTTKEIYGDVIGRLVVYVKNSRGELLTSYVSKPFTITKTQKG